jgi:hypothetical protein
MGGEMGIGGTHGVGLVAPRRSHATPFGRLCVGRDSHRKTDHRNSLRLLFGTFGHRWKDGLQSAKHGALSSLKSKFPGNLAAEWIVHQHRRFRKISSKVVVDSELRKSILVEVLS